MSNVNSSKSLFRLGRIGVGGGSAIGDVHAKFCHALGKELVAQERVVIVNVGCKRRVGHPKNLLSADWWIVQGALRELGRKGIDPEKCIETILPGDDRSRIEKFTAWRSVVLRNKTPQARRFALVSCVDARLWSQEGKEPARA